MSDTRKSPATLEQVGGTVKGHSEDTAKLSAIGDTFIFTSHRQGARPTQEDGDIFFECEFVKSFDKETRNKLMKKSCSRADKECKRLELKGGACIGATISWLAEDKKQDEKKESKNKPKIELDSYYAGDVAIFLVSQNEDGKLSIKRQNERLHTVDNHIPSEKFELALRIKERKKDGPLRIGRKDQVGLMLYRSLGDFDYNDSGHSSELDYVNTQFTAPSEQLHGILIACDGVTECLSRFKETSFQKYLTAAKEKNVIPALMNGNKFIPVAEILQVAEEKSSKQEIEKQQMEKFIKLAIEQSLPDVAPALTETSQKRLTKKEMNLAYQLTNWGVQFSGDNVSALWQKIGKTAVCSMILDGHGGREIVDYMKTNFQRIFFEEAYQLMIKKILSKEAKEKFSPIINVMDIFLHLPMPEIKSINPEAKLFSGKNPTHEMHDVKILVFKYGLQAIHENKPEIFSKTVMRALISIWEEPCLDRLKKAGKEPTPENLTLIAQQVRKELSDPKTAVKIPNHQLLLAIGLVIGVIAKDTPTLTPIKIWRI